MNNCTIALIQNSICDDKRKNVLNAVKAIEYAAGNGADIAVLPEMFCCRYNKEAITSCAELSGNFIYRKLSQSAGDNNIYVVGGSMPELSGNGNIYNTGYVFDRKGNEIARHRKSHLFDVNIEGGISYKESDIVTAGNDITIFNTEFGKIGLCICYDFRFPEQVRLMANRGAVMTIVPAVFNMTTGPAHWELLFRSRAVDNQMYTVGAAPARDENSEYVSYGHSIIVSPWGEVITQMDGKEGICLSTVDMDMVRQVREQLPLLTHRRTDMYMLRKV